QPLWNSVKHDSGQPPKNLQICHTAELRASSRELRANRCPGFLALSSQLVAYFCYPPPMDLLWTPWRYAYVTGADQKPGCIFCDAPKESDQKARIVHRGAHCYIILNTYPYTNGHVMVVPYAH